MHKQRVALAFTAFTGLISPFFTWVKVEDSLSLSIIPLFKTPGIFGIIPIAIPVLFLISLLISLSGNKVTKIQQHIFFKLIPPATCTLIDILYIWLIRMDHDKAGIGLYINVAAAALFMIILLVGAVSQNIQAKTKKIIATVSILIFLSIGVLFYFYTTRNQRNLTTSTKSSYEWVKDWPQLPNGYPLGNPTGIGIDTNQNIFIFHRANRAWSLIRPMPETFIKENTILLLNKQTGKMMAEWGAGLFIMPHGLTVDKENNVWVTDVGLHQVFKFSHDGRLLMKLGEAKMAGHDSAHFNQPTDVTVAANGSFYVSDGYGNNRVVKFSPSGQYLLEWGIAGKQAGQFNIPHAIDLDSAGNVYVADRENNRVQVFDPNGKFMYDWKNKEEGGKIYAVAVDKIKDEFVAVDYRADYLVIPVGSDIFLHLKNGPLLQFGRSGGYDGPACRYHDVAIDKEGNIYVGDILNNRVQKFKRRF